MKTIDLLCKEWFDKVNGNSYFSCKVTINYGMEDEKEYYIPFQYGYGDQYEWEVMKSIDSSYKRGLYAYCRDNNIIIRSRKEKALKRVCKSCEY